jgi:hypothetical protein
MSSKSDKSQPAADAPSEKEARLADALRANLRRRKAPKKKPDPSKPSP